MAENDSIKRKNKKDRKRIRKKELRHTDLKKKEIKGYKEREEEERNLPGLRRKSREERG